MKSIFITAISVLTLFTIVTLSSCKEDLCKSVVCAYGGICQPEDGSCICPTGYEGAKCETITRDKFKGIYRVIEDGTGSNPADYATAIEDGDVIDQVYILNFYNMLNARLAATVKNDTIIIPTQEVEMGEDTKVIEGMGVFTPEPHYNLKGRITFRYRVVSSDGRVDNFGTQGADNPSIWTK